MMCITHNTASFSQATCRVCELEVALKVSQQLYDALRSERDELANTVKDLIADLRAAPTQRELEDLRAERRALQSELARQSRKFDALRSERDELAGTVADLRADEALTQKALVAAEQAAEQWTQKYFAI